LQELIDSNGEKIWKQCLNLIYITKKK
jgi:hypothetical protein